MRTNGFALFRGPEARAEAKRASERVERHGHRTLLSPAEDLEEWKESDRSLLLTYALDDSKELPLVHGFVERRATGRAVPAGEFAFVATDERGAVFAARDVLGTRPLFVDERGSCIATDRALLTGKSPRLLGTGTRHWIDEPKMRETPEVRLRQADEEKMSLDVGATRTAGLLRKAVRKRVGGRRKVAVSFSGGLDSSLIAFIAAQEGVEVLLCSAFVEGSRDESQTRAAAGLLGLELSTTRMDRASMAEELRSIDLPFEPTSMDKALWCIYSTTARQAAEGGASLIMLGQLADELFGGYMKYTRAARDEGGAAARGMMRSDVVASGDRAFLRDEKAVSRFTEIRFPFADEELVDFALKVPLEYKVGEESGRKLLLRRAAALVGLPEELVNAPKKAAQFSSGAAKLVS